MEGLFAVIIYVMVILVIVSKFVKKNNSNKSKGQYKVPQTHNNTQPVNSVAREVSKGADLKSYRAERSTHTLMEDRSNDWLAKQFREERRSLRVLNAMFGHEFENNSSCDAQMLREFHAANCSAGGIDNPGK